MQSFETLRKARNHVKNLNTASKSIEFPEIVEIIKRTTTQIILNVYKPKAVQTLMINDLDNDL